MSTMQVIFNESLIFCHFCISTTNVNVLQSKQMTIHANVVHHLISMFSIKKLLGNQFYKQNVLTLSESENLM